MAAAALSVISSEAVRETVIQTIDHLVQSKKFAIDVSSASKAGENNFIGIIHRIKIRELDDDGNENGPTTHLIVKDAPQQTLRRQQFFVRPAFQREIFTYETVNDNQVAYPNLIIPKINSYYFYRFYLRYGNLSNQNLRISSGTVSSNIRNAIERSKI